jgi:RNA exonuclease 4
VRTRVSALLTGKIVVGHALFNDLAALEHRHVYEDVRDTALFYPLRERMGIKNEGKFPGLRALTKDVLGRDIQDSEHSPVRTRVCGMQRN